MNIIDHLSVGISCIDKATSFYDGLLGTLGYERLATNDRFSAYGKDSIQFLVIKPENGKTFTVGNGMHICFIAPTQESVRSFYEYATHHDGKCAGEPGPREGYPTPNVYTAFVRDPFGNKIEAIFNGFNQ